MIPTIITTTEKKLVGVQTRMSLANNKTGELWKSFMPRRKEIENKLSNDLFSVQIYSPGYFENFSPSQEFEKWAAVEVSDHGHLPDGMQTFTIPAGTYAVFHYKGSSHDTRIFQYIYGTWLPESGYLLDERPHFEVLGEKYKNADPDSEEDIWIPIRPKV